MRCLVDANLPTNVTEVLRRCGFDVRDVRAAAPPLTDQQVYEIARQEQRTLLTRDLDFSNMLRYPARGTAGIVVLRVPGMATAEIAALLENFLRTRTTEDLRDTLLILEPFRVRVRRDLE